MKNTIASNGLLADTKELSKAANVIREEAEGFKNDLKRLEECLEELQLYWEGNAASRFHQNMFCDFLMLRNAREVFIKLSEDYAFAVNEYLKNEQRAMDIVTNIC